MSHAVGWFRSRLGMPFGQRSRGRSWTLPCSSVRGNTRHGRFRHTDVMNGRSRLVFVALMVASCTAPGDSLTPGSSCVDPPLSELERPSPVALTVEPNPVSAGFEAILSVSAAGLPSDIVSGAGVAWQCWNGSDWVPTSHQVVRGWSGEPLTLFIEPGAITTVPAIGLPIPNSYPILIPDEPPGVYRIKDVVGVVGGSDIVGFVFVEVVDR